MDSKLNCLRTASVSEGRSNLVDVEIGSRYVAVVARVDYVCLETECLYYG